MTPPPQGLPVMASYQTPVEKKRNSWKLKRKEFPSQIANKKQTTSAWLSNRTGVPWPFPWPGELGVSPKAGPAASASPHRTTAFPRLQPDQCTVGRGIADLAAPTAQPQRPPLPRTHCSFLSQPWLQPALDFIQSEVDPNQAQLPTPFDQLVWLDHQALEQEGFAFRTRGERAE